MKLHWRSSTFSSRCPESLCSTKHLASNTMWSEEARGRKATRADIPESQPKEKSLMLNQRFPGIQGFSLIREPFALFLFSPSRLWGFASLKITCGKQSIKKNMTVGGSCQQFSIPPPPQIWCLSASCHLTPTQRPGGLQQDTITLELLTSPKSL